MTKLITGMLTCGFLSASLISASAACVDGEDQTSPVGKGFDKIHYTVPADDDGSVQIQLFVDGNPRDDGPATNVTHHTEGYLTIHHPEAFKGKPGESFKVRIRPSWHADTVKVTCDLDNNQTMIYGQPNGRSFVRLDFQWK